MPSTVLNLCVCVCVAQGNILPFSFLLTSFTLWMNGHSISDFSYSDNWKIGNSFKVGNYCLCYCVKKKRFFFFLLTKWFMRFTGFPLSKEWHQRSLYLLLSNLCPLVWWVNILKKVEMVPGSSATFRSRGAPVTCITLLDIISKEQTFYCLSKFMGKPFPVASSWWVQVWLGNVDSVKVDSIVLMHHF